MSKKGKVLLSILGILGFSIVLSLVLKLAIINSDGIYFKKDSVGDYTLYQAPKLIGGGDDMIEVIYEDDNTTYYFSNPLSEYYRLKKGNETLTLEEALEEGAVTPEDLMEKIDELHSMSGES